MDKKISELDLVTTLDTGDVLPIVNQLTTKKVTVAKLIDGLATTAYVNSQDALKVDKVTGKGLSTEDYTTAEKSKLAGIAAGAEVNVNADWNAVSGDAQILNKPTIPSVTGFVPYTGATTNVDLGEFELKAGQVSLDLTPTGTPTVGTTQWNDSFGSTQTTLKGGTVILKNGVDLVARIVNKVTPNTTLTKANYQAVRISGAQGQRLAVELARANNDANSADTIGLVTETIATNQEGFIITMGQIEDINTTGSLQGETWVDGDVLYLSPTTAGQLTNIKPTGLTGHIVVIGYVEYAHAIQGKIYVKVMNGWELDELHNVYIDNTLANEDFLQYESATQLWKNKQLTSTFIKSKLSQSAYTILANNTNASAVPTEQVFENITNATYDGATPTWTGTTAPSGTTQHTYSLSQVGNMVTLIINLSYATAGSNLTAVTFDLPSTAPTPALPSSVTTALDVINYGNGMIAVAKTIPAATAPFCALRLKSTSPNVCEVVINRTAASYRYAYATIQYFV